MDRKTLFRRMRKSSLFMIGAIGILSIVLACFLSSFYMPYDPIQSDLHMRLCAPEWFSNGLQGHILGTDALGRDVLTRVLDGGRSSLIIAISVTVPSAIIGIALGLLAGFFSGVTERIIMRFCDIMSAIPGLMLAICIVAVLGASFTNLIITLTITSWVITTRIVRSSVLTLRNQEYVQAARVLGASNMRIMISEILPNVLTPVLINESQHFAAIVLTEASMSFLGLGVPLPQASWGGMISDGREYLMKAPWTVIAPGIALMLAVLFINFLGDGLRDVLDPKNRK